METLPVLRKHSSIIRQRNTTVSLEDDFWDGFREIAKRQKLRSQR